MVDIPKYSSDDIKIPKIIITEIFYNHNIKPLEVFIALNYNQHKGHVFSVKYISARIIICQRFHNMNNYNPINKKFILENKLLWLIKDKVITSYYSYYMITRDERAYSDIVLKK